MLDSHETEATLEALAQAGSAEALASLLACASAFSAMAEDEFFKSRQHSNLEQLRFDDPSYDSYY